MSSVAKGFSCFAFGKGIVRPPKGEAPKLDGGD